MEIRSKLFADLLEAMLGAIYLTIRDLEGAISFLQSIQLLPPLSLRDHDNFGSKAHHNMGLLSPVEVHQIESILGYTFKDSYLLSMACTHPSYTHIAMASYERLEFLGDAVLDFCVVEVIYPQEDKYPDEGALTDEKCRRTRNTALAAVANRLGLYRFVRHNIIGLGGFRYGEREEEIDSTDSSISEYVEGSLSTEQPSDGDDIDEEDDGSYPIIGEEHKAWADVVEALVGAVFLDSEFSLEVVKKVVAKLGIVKHMN